MKPNSARRTIIEAVGLGWLGFLAVHVYVIWTMAALNGGSVVVSVNHFGEMYVELLFLHAVVFPTVAVGLVYFIQGRIRATRPKSNLQKTE